MSLSLLDKMRKLASFFSDVLSDALLRIIHNEWLLSEKRILETLTHTLQILQQYWHNIFVLSNIDQHRCLQCENMYK